LQAIDVLTHGLEPTHLPANLRPIEPSAVRFICFRTHNWKLTPPKPSALPAAVNSRNVHLLWV
ncbi:MAG: hypothetical protein ACK50J_03505, partial [Planctomyces sp.]